MADFLSDMNALTQSVGNAANSISHLYQVRTDLESKRIASQIQKENYNFIMRTKLPLEDPNRIDLDNWRPELEAHNSRNQELVDSTRWDSVKGAVSQSVEPINQRFSLEVADAYAGQEIQKAQIDGQISLENNLSTADTPEKMEAFIKDFDDYQNAYGLYPPDVYQKNIIPIYDNARAGLLFNKAVTDTKSTLVDSSPDPSDPNSVVTEQKKADLVSATETISSSTSNPRVKAQAMARLQAYSKQQTASLQDSFKQLFTNNKDARNVNEAQLESLLDGSRFADTDVVKGFRLELQGYQADGFNLDATAIINKFTGPGSTKDSRDAARPAAKQAVDSFFSTTPEWYKNGLGQKDKSEWYDKINMWEQDQKEDGIDKTFDNTYRYMDSMLYDLDQISSVRGAGLFGVLSGVNAVESGATKYADEGENNERYTAQYSQLRSHATGIAKAVIGKMAETYSISADSTLAGVPNQLVVMLRNGMSKDDLKKYDKLSANPKDASPQEQQWQIDVDRRISDEIMRAARDKGGKDITKDEEKGIILRVLDYALPGFKEATKSNSTYGKEAVNAGAKDAEVSLAEKLLGLQSSGQSLTTVNPLNGKKEMSVDAQTAINQIIPLARDYIAKTRKADPGSLQITSDKNGFPVLSLSRTVKTNIPAGLPGSGEEKTVSETFTVVAVNDDGHKRLGVKIGNNVEFLDGLPAWAQMKKNQQISFNRKEIEQLQNPGGISVTAKDTWE